MRRNSIRASIRSNRSAISTTSGGFSDMGHTRIIEDPQRAIPMKGGGSLGGAARMNGLHGSFDSISKSNFNSSMEEDPSFVVYEETPQSPPGYTSELDNRFSADPNLENANVNELVHPSFNMTFQNHGYRDNSTFTSRENSTFIAEAPSQQWNGSNNNIPPSSTTSSFKNESLHGSNPQLAASSVTTDSTLEMKKELDLARDTQDPHLTATLPRDQAAPFHYVSADVLSGRQSKTPSEVSEDYFSQGRSQSQPLETAM
ncbi:hypothetical protein OTU49_016043 [Cherax quadricarinatus]|uniref:Uncharacterized protein n=2 Tax=Cherax quadricarinatus TaxID=27406 RepID=A0AAW0XYJ1_CHEQU